MAKTYYYKRSVLSCPTNVFCWQREILFVVFIVMVVVIVLIVVVVKVVVVVVILIL